jgi:hypothetical protein
LAGVCVATRVAPATPGVPDTNLCYNQFMELAEKDGLKFWPKTVLEVGKDLTWG